MRARQPDDVGEVEAAEPLAVEANLGLLGVDDREGLLDVGLGVGVDLLRRQDRPLCGAAGRVADPGRVVADDEDADVAGVLEGAHPLQRNPAADVEVGGRDVDAELDAQRTPELQLLLEPALGQDVDGVAGEILDAHGPADSTDVRLGDRRPVRCSHSSASASSVSSRSSSSTWRAPCSPPCGEPPEDGTADEHRPGTERERRDHVAAAADAAVDEHLDAPIDRLDRFGQQLRRRRDAVELAAAVVRDDDRRRRRARRRARRPPRSGFP